ncbi:MAG: metallophosphoesterase [Pseudomonadota bacterium]
MKILFLSDTHLGFDLPLRPRVERPRRGRDFFANFRLALAPALEGRVDLVVHGGDLFFRSRVPAWLAQEAFGPLLEIADRGVPVYLVPGNHERSVLPRGLLARHPLVRVFDQPSTYLIKKDNLTLALSGFPFERSGARENFPSLLKATGWRQAKAEAKILCLHHAVEGAVVGPGDFTFRRQPDVIRAADIPRGLTAVLAGHIHRRQVLTRDLSGRPLAAPVFFSGSIERASFAEKDETKGYFILDVGPAGRLENWSFKSLPARPMAEVILPAASLDRDQVEARLRAALSDLPGDGVVKIKVEGRPKPETLAVLSAASLRRLAPPTMNVSVSWETFVFPGPKSTGPSPEADGLPEIVG